MNGLKASGAILFAYLLMGSGSQQHKLILIARQDTIARNIRQIEHRLHILSQNEDIKQLRQRRIDSIVALVKKQHLKP